MPLSCLHLLEFWRGESSPPPRPARPGRKGWEPRRPPLPRWNPSLTLTPALAFPDRDDAGARPPLRSPRKSAQVVDVKDAAYLHAYLHIFACSFNVSVCRTFPSPVGGDFVFLRGCAPGLSSLPRTPEPASLAHPGRRQAPRSGKGFSSLPDPDMRPGLISHPCRGLPLSHLFTRNDENCKWPVGTELPLPGLHLCPHLPPVKSARRPKPGPELPGPLHCCGGVSGGRGALNLSPTAASLVPAVSRPH